MHCKCPWSLVLQLAFATKRVDLRFDLPEEMSPVRSAQQAFDRRASRQIDEGSCERAVSQFRG